MRNHSAHPANLPTRQREFYQDAASAQIALAAAERIRKLTEEYAAAVAKELTGNDLWSDESLPAWATTPLREGNDEARAKRLRMLVDELIDEQLHQGKLEEAGEIV